MSNNPEQLDTANREFEQIGPSVSTVLSQRLTQGFQIATISPGLKFLGPTNYSAPGSVPNQTGPSLAANFFSGGGDGFGDSSPMFFNVINNPPLSGTANPESVPATGPEEKIRYSCVDGRCLQDPNGDYLGLEECLAAPCISSGGGPGDDPCDCGYGPSLTIFKARITGITNTEPGSSSGGKTYWTYSFTEVTAGTPRTNVTLGSPARNEHELTMPNNGGNSVPAGTTITRKRIPNDAVVPLFLDEDGIPWFHFINPLGITCT